MPAIDRDGVNIHYEDHGKGPAILLSHGYSATCRMWDGQIEALKDRYRVIVWDMRGHGQSDYPADQSLYSEAATVGDMKAILDHCGVDRAVIGGLSLGGYMSMAFHVAHPERCRALMLFDTGPGYKSDSAREEWNRSAHQRADRLEREGLAALGPSDEVRMSTHRSADGLARAARGMLTQVDSRIINSLETIRIPTLALVGAEDKNFLNAMDYIAKKIPNATRVVIPDAGHAANLHQPTRFNDAVISFLGKLPPDKLSQAG